MKKSRLGQPMRQAAHTISIPCACVRGKVIILYICSLLIATSQEIQMSERRVNVTKLSIMQINHFSLHAELYKNIKKYLLIGHVYQRHPLLIGGTTVHAH